MKKSQKEWVEQQLKEQGFVTNVDAFNHQILRLGAIIKILREKGWEIDGDYIEGTKNWKYKLVKPAQKWVSEFIPVEKDGVRMMKEVRKQISV